MLYEFKDGLTGDRIFVHGACTYRAMAKASTWVQWAKAMPALNPHERRAMDIFENPAKGAVPQLAASSEPVLRGSLSRQPNERNPLGMGEGWSALVLSRKTVLLISEACVDTDTHFQRVRQANAQAYLEAHTKPLSEGPIAPRRVGRPKAWSLQYRMGMGFACKSGIMCPANSVIGRPNEVAEIGELCNMCAAPR